MDNKKRACLLTLLLAASGCAAANTAQKLPIDVNKGLCDGNVTTYREGPVEISSQTPVAALYVKWLEAPGEWSIEGGEAQSGDTAVLHQLIRLKTPQKHVIISGGSAISELEAYGKGKLPESVQEWQTAKSADMLIIAAHPDDELVFMGGLLPYYSARGKSIQTVYMTHENRARRSEALDGLWECGVRQYPVFMGYEDVYCDNAEEAFDAWGGRAAVEEKLRGALEEYSPDVVVTHDINGEYGHGAHKAASECVSAVIKRGDTPVQKLYLHLSEKAPIRMDWNAPLAALGGKTALEVAESAFKKHRSQSLSGYDVTGGEYDSAAFGLEYSTVADDIKKDDMFENIDIDS